MKPKPRTLRGICGEVFSEGYFSRAMLRARRRKSPWNLLLIPLAVAGAGTAFYVLFLLMWQVHTVVYPEHAGMLGQFWRKGIGLPSFVSSFLLAVPLLFVAIPAGMIAANLICSLISPARRAIEQEAHGIEGASLHATVVELGKIALVLLPACLLLSLIGAATLRTLH